MLGERRMVQKRTFYEYSSRIPWIMAHPQLGAGGVTVQEPVSIVDVKPTVLDFIGTNQENILPIDGQSVLPLINGQHEPERAVFSELHAEGVNTTCFMVRQGDFKYIHVTGYGPQLYNLVDDPKEWNNLAGKPGYQEIEAKLHGLIMARFDPDAIEVRVQDSLARRSLIREAMRKTGQPKWDHQPFFDATRQYWREG
jgi:choline-sulfatase